MSTPSALQNKRSPVSDDPSAPRCPQCGSCEPWGLSSWCPKCGYYPKLKQSIPIGSAPAQQGGEESLPELEQLPPWVWPLAGGMGAILVASVTVRLLLPDIAIRGNVAFVQLGMGVLAYAVACVRLYLKASFETEKITFGSLFFSPGNLWQWAFRKLPGTRYGVYAGAWGATAALCAVLIVGINWDMLFKPPSHYRRLKRANPMKAVSEMVRQSKASQAIEEEVELEDALEEAAGSGKQDQSADEPQEELTSADGEEQDPQATADGKRALAGEQSRPNGETQNGMSGKAALKPKQPVFPRLVVFGYLANGRGEVRSILLAEQTGATQGRFAGKLSLFEADRALCQRLQEMLEKHPMDRPAWACPFNANWVQPVVVCRLKNEQRTPDGIIRQGELSDVFPATEVVQPARRQRM